MLLSTLKNWSLREINTSATNSGHLGALHTCQSRESAEHAPHTNVVCLACTLELVVAHLDETAGHNDNALLLQEQVVIIYALLCIS